MAQELELHKTDLASLLATLADRLRGTGLALTGLAHENADSGDPDYRVMAELNASLERTARVLEEAGRSLCPRCRLIEVAEALRIGSPDRNRLPMRV